MTRRSANRKARRRATFKTWRIRRARGVQVLHCAALEKIPWLVHGFSTRLNGFSQAYRGRELNLGFTHHDTREAVERNRAAFLRAIGAQDWQLVAPVPWIKIEPASGKLEAGQEETLIECTGDWCELSDPPGWVFRGCLLEMAGGLECRAK